MATKLDESIAKVAIAIGSRDRALMDQVAKEAAVKLTAKDLAKLPDRWYPSFSAAKAGAPELKDSWHHEWFEAATELLFQKKQEGLPGLLLLMDRDDSTYHQFAVLRLLRLAVEGLERDMILARIRTRFLTLQHIWVRASVSEVVYWKQVDDRPVELLKSLSDIVVKNMDGDTVGTFLEQSGESLVVHLARMKEMHG